MEVGGQRPLKNNLIQVSLTVNRKNILLNILEVDGPGWKFLSLQVESGPFDASAGTDYMTNVLLFSVAFKGQHQKQSQALSVVAISRLKGNRLMEFLLS